RPAVAPEHPAGDHIAGERPQVTGEVDEARGGSRCAAARKVLGCPTYQPDLSAVQTEAGQRETDDRRQHADSHDDTVNEGEKADTDQEKRAHGRAPRLEKAIGHPPRREGAESTREGKDGRLERGGQSP